MYLTRSFAIVILGAVLGLAVGCGPTNPTHTSGPEDTRESDPGTPSPGTPPKFVELIKLPWLSDDDTKVIDEAADRARAAGIQQVTFTPDARTVIAGGTVTASWITGGKVSASPEKETVRGNHGIVKLWELSSGKPTALLKHVRVGDVKPEITGLAVSPDGQRLWVGGTTDLAARTKVWSLTNHKELAELSAGAPKFHPNGRWVVTTPHDSPCVFDATTGKAVEEFKVYSYGGNEEAPILCGGGWDISPDGGWIACRTGEHSRRANSLLVVSTVAGRKPIELATAKDPLGLPARLFYTPDGDRLVGLSHPTYGPLETERPDYVRCWSVSGRKVLWTVKVASLAENIALSPDGNWVAIGCGDKTVRILSAAGGEEKSALKGHTSAVTAVGFSKDGKLFASGDTDSIRVWKKSE